VGSSSAGIQDVVVIGAGVAGLGAALGLARSGRRVTVIDRDPAPLTLDPEAAFDSWERSGVPQARQPHGFWARSRNLLLQHAPEVIDRLRDAGVGEWNILDMAPPEARVPEDQQFTSLLVRRLPFEVTLRGVAAEEPLVEIRPETLVDRIEFATDRNDAPPRATAVRLRGGEMLPADLVIDASGRRSRLVSSLAEQGVTVPAEVEDCNVVYYGRYYRQREESDLNPDELFRRGGGDLGYIAYGLFGGDNGTLALFLTPPPWDTPFKALRHEEVWEAVARAIPACAPWVDPQHTTPITGIQPMAGHQNVLRRFVVNGRPLALGVLPVGDSLCTTNPANAWGASLALTYAFAAVDAITEQDGDLGKIATAYDDAVLPDAEAYFRASAAIDRIRTYRWRGEEVPDEDRGEAERQHLLQEGLNPAMRRDMHVLRAMMRRLNLIDPPDAIWSDEEAVRIGNAQMEWRAANPRPVAIGPPREEMLEIVAEAEATMGEATPAS
jgi:2-polyprenyl-6-methoxyphenol hydroxylase-like FAD-dependent oxidoreductase